MEIIPISYPCDFSFHPKPSSIAIGFFDGVHLGHQHVIKEAVQDAKSHGLQAGVMTFDPHPRSVFGNHEYTFCITPLEEKLRMIRGMGVDLAYVVSFEPSFARISPQEFVENVLVPLRVEAAAVGFDFSFGAQGKGKVQDLRELSRNRVRVKEIPPIQLHSQKISSTLIRKQLANGQMKEVNRCLGRPFTIYGKYVQTGKQNITLPLASVLPRCGQYEVKVGCSDRWFSGLLTISDEGQRDIREKAAIRLDLECYPESVWTDILQIAFVDALPAQKDNAQKMTV